jgi:nucleotide-binding universal stress UspA family protein
MKNILVLTDFMPASRAASEYAASLAQLFKAKVHLLNIYSQPTPVTEVPAAWTIVAEELQKASDSNVKKEVDYLKATYLIDITGLSRMGYKGDTIIEMIKTLKADLVVMGMKGVKRSRILGSTTFMAIRRSKVPVLVIHEGVLYTPIKHVILASDFDEASNVSSYNFLFDILEKSSATLEVLHVQPKGKVMVGADVPGKIQLGHLLSNRTFMYEEVEEDDVDKGIQRFVESHPADLLVMVEHRHSLLERLFGTIHTWSMSTVVKVPFLVLEDKT